MKNPVLIVVMIVSVALVSAVIFFGLAPLNNPADASAAPVPVQPVTPQNAEQFAVRTATLQAQIAQLQQSLSERQTTYAGQLAELDAVQATIDEKLSGLEQQDQLLLQQLDDVRAERDTRNDQYAQLLAQTSTEYAGRAAEITSRLNEAQVRLAEVNQLLGR